ncbi:MAG: amidohydrolase [Pseudomonadales bacterium]
MFDLGASADKRVDGLFALGHDVHGCACCAPMLPAVFEATHGRLDADRSVPAGAPRPTQSGTLTLVNARILTMNALAPEAEAMVIREGRIVYVGSRQEAEPFADEASVTIDCAGRTVLPGFIEPHLHLIPIALLEHCENLGPFRYPTVDEALRALAGVVAATPPGEWVVGRQFDPSLQTGPRELTRDLLDAVSTAHPILIYNASLHIAYCNSSALQRAGLTAHTPNPPGAEIGRDADGAPNGVLKGGAAIALVARHNTALRSTDPAAACLAVLGRANRVGFTTVCDQGTGLMQGGAELALYARLRESGAMTCRFRYSLGDARAADWDRAAVACGEGDAWMRATGWKIVSDGSNQGLTGLQRAPYLNADHSGIAYVQADALRDKVMQRLAAGWQVAVHANGDRAIDNALDAFAAAAAAGLNVSERRCRIEHCSILHDEHIERMRALGVSPSFLIGHVYWWGQAFRDVIFGPDKAALLDRTAACEAAGIRWTLHSDEPVTEMGPLRCIQNAVTRALWRDPEHPLAPEECVSVEAALRAMTIDAAWQCHSDHEIGSLEAGKFADFVVLAADPRRVPVDQIGAIAVEQTWVEGVCVHSRAEASA